MPLPTGADVATLIVADLGDSNEKSLEAWTKVCNQIIAAVKLASVVPIPGPNPAPGLTAPPGTAGGPVTGTGSLT